MKTKLALALLAAAGVFAVGASAQVAHPSTPAPALSATPAPSRVIYSPRLPTTTELSNVAIAQGLTIDRIDQTDAEVTVTYHNAAGSVTTVAYRMLSTATAAPVTSPAPTQTVVYAPTPAPTVIYAEPYSYYAAPYYDPWGYYGPVSVSLGFGFYRGFHGGFRGGFHGHRHW